MSLSPETISRRQFLTHSSTGIGATALASLLESDGLGASGFHFAPKAKRVIYLFQSGGPSQMDLFDPKPRMQAMFDQDLPDSVRRGQRVTTMTSRQDRFPIAPSMFDFAQHGTSGAWLSELVPHTARIADKICFVKSMVTDAINHDPAITFFQTGSQIAGRPSMGAWASYGLGKENANLPAFVAMTSRSRLGGQPLYDRLWGGGFLPAKHQGVRFREQGDPILDILNPAGVDDAMRRRMMDVVSGINRRRHEHVGDPDIATRIAQYDLAYRMQMSVPDLNDFSDEPESTFALYGDDARASWRVIRGDRSPHDADRSRLALCRRTDRSSGCGRRLGADRGGIRHHARRGPARTRQLGDDGAAGARAVSRAGRAREPRHELLCAAHDGGRC